MFKTMLVLDEKKIEDEGLYSVSHYKKIIEEICNSELFEKEDENLFTLNENVDSVGVCILLFSQFKKANILYLLKKWITFSDEEGESEEIIQEDFLDICNKRGLLYGNNKETDCI